MDEFVFKRKTAKMPNFQLSESTELLSEQLVAQGRLEDRVLAQILEHNDSLEKKIDWSMGEIMEMNHVQSQLIKVSGEHEKKIDGLEKREENYKIEVAAYIRFLVVICTFISFVITIALTYFFK
jgi:hypothetical protein